MDDHVFIRPYVSEGVTRGGIILPDSAARADQMGRGTVVATGPGRMGKIGRNVAHGVRVVNDYRLPMAVSEGDEVLFIEMEDEGIHLGGERLVVMRDEDVLAILEK